MAKTKYIIKSDELKIITERIFDAPREVIWKIMIDPKLVSQYWGPENNFFTVEKMDLKKGGEWRFVQTDSNGTPHVFFGTYKKIESLQLIQNTFNYELMGPGHEIFEIITLDKIADNKTRIVNVASYPSKQDLDIMVKWGMKSVVEKWERLAKLVNSI